MFLLHRAARRASALVGTILLLLAAYPGNSEPNARRTYIAGGESGLYRITAEEGEFDARLVWTSGSVRSLTAAPERFYMLTSSGLYWLDAEGNGPVAITSGLPKRTLSVFESGAFSLREEPAQLKAFAVDPQNPRRLLACTSNSVLLSEDGGVRWTSLGAPSPIPGLRTVSFGPAPQGGKSSLWASHSIKGVFRYSNDNEGNWTLSSKGLPAVIGANVEEVSSLLFTGDSSGQGSLYAGLSFLGRLYRWDESTSAFVLVYSDGKDFSHVEDIQRSRSGGIAAIVDGRIASLQGQPQRLASASPHPAPASAAGFVPDEATEETARKIAETLMEDYGDRLNCFAESAPGGAGAVNEAWRLAGIPSFDPDPDSRARKNAADAKNGLYLQTGFIIDPASRAKYFSLMERLGLDMIVVDLKDDYGRLRFKPYSPLLSSMGKTGAALDIEAFAAEAKSRGIYLVARIVAFKDETLYGWNAGALAVRDSSASTPWRGRKADGSLIGEHWVDPYSTTVWRYNVEIAREVVARGFDEVQFDYIRFPTDGENLAAASYPSRRPGMEQDSAIESFLRYARSQISAPISVDIYGANGWYRSAVRTGQDVEMLSEYVDVICPMLYPSHFEQIFLAQEPAELRPYRIYRLGTSRNLTIARNKVLVRPYVQSFYLDVSYDRSYYSARYVEDEVRGVREGADQGMTFWNNSGRYDEVPPLR